MKRHSIATRLLTALMAIMMVVCLIPLSASAAAPSVTGMISRGTQRLKAGTVPTTVKLYEYELQAGSKYAGSSTNAQLKVVEVTPSDTISIRVLNGDNYTHTTGQMTSMVNNFNTANPGATVLAAINGDPWLMYHSDYDGDGNASTGALSVKHVSIPRGLTIIDGEMWCSNQIDDENNMAVGGSAAEYGQPVAPQPAFGIKANGKGFSGVPKVSVSITNNTRNKTQTAEGANRLPAPNSAILYNHRTGTQSMAYEDAYEIYLECDDAAFRLSDSTTGRVVDIYQSGSTNRPDITEKTVIISARGAGINKTQRVGYQVGDEVTITFDVVDEAVGSQSKVWKTAQQSIGGFYYLRDRNNARGQNLTANYPCSIIGYKDDGTIMMTTITPVVDGTRNCVQMKNLPDLCEELGYKTAMQLDGGGSACMITMEGGSYVRKSATVDGANSPRKVVNGIAVVYDPTPKPVDPAETQPGGNTPVETQPPVTEEETFDENEGFETFEVPETQAPEETEAPPAASGGPSFNSAYYVKVDSINGVRYANMVGQRDFEFKSSWTDAQKAATIKPAVSPGKYMDPAQKLVLSGWGFVNNGQGEHCWSVDGLNWFVFDAGTYSEGDRENGKIAKTQAGLTNAVTDNAVFTDLTCDLADYIGETVTVYIGVKPRGKDEVCHYLTVKDFQVIQVDEPVETETPSEEETAEKEWIVETIIEEYESEYTVEVSGCSGTLIGGGAMLLASAVAAAVVLRRKED